MWAVNKPPIFFQKPIDNSICMIIIISVGTTYNNILRSDLHGKIEQYFGGA